MTGDTILRAQTAEMTLKVIEFLFCFVFSSPLLYFKTPLGLGNKSVLFASVYQVFSTINAVE